MKKGFLALIVMFVASIITAILMTMRDNLGIHSIPYDTFLSGAVYFLYALFSTIAVLVAAVNNKENDAAFLFLSITGIVLLISIIVALTCLAFKYVEVAAFLILLVAYLIIIELLGDTETNKNHLNT